MSKYLFFSGKGGVGKTTMAAATAVYNAEAGRKTLIISTDPASNLGDIFEKTIGHRITDIAPNLSAMEIDPDVATEEYKEKVLGPMRAILPEDVMLVMEEQFRSACTIEIAAFDRFTDYLTNNDYDVIVFDTAPTGHTIRLLELPIDWSKHIEESAKGGGNTCLGPVSSIQGSKEKYDNAIKAMRDAMITKFYMVMKPEKTSIAEAIRAHDELKKLGIDNYEIIINGIIPDEVKNGNYDKIIQAQEDYIKAIGASLPYPSMKVYLQSGEVKGIANIRAFSKIIYEGSRDTIKNSFRAGNVFNKFSIGPMLREMIERKLDHRIIIITGKGGVGKTVAACAFATRLARDGHKTLLVTTDPAAHIGYVLDEKIDSAISQMKSVPNLFAARIDQKKSVETYKAKIITDAEKNGYSGDMLMALKEELESPCTEEMAVFEEFSRLINGDYEYIVFDTAPTGHTLRLLELPYDYAKQIEMMVNVNRDTAFADDAKKNLEKLVARLKNRDFCSFFLVFYPEYTPIFEAKRTLDDLKLAGIDVQAVIANNILAPDAESEFFTSRYNMQQHYLKIADEQFKLPMFKIKMFDEEIIGLAKLGKVEEELFQ